MSELSGADRETDNYYLAFAELSQYVTALVLYPIVSVVGMTGSALCIAVLSQRQMLTSTNAYLIALAVADLMKLANDFLYFPATLLQMSGSRTGGLVFAHLYPYAFFLSQYTSGVSAWLTVIVAGERCLMVTHPNWSRYSLTVRKSRVLSAITYVTLLVVTAPYLLRYETVCLESPVNATELVTLNNCTWMPRPSRLWSESGFANYSKYYVQCQSCLKSLIPLLILIVLNIRIVMAVRETRANKKLASRNRVTVMLAMVILCYIVFTTPDSALSAMGWGYTEVTTNLKRGIREICDLLLAVNSSVNFFLYVAFNRLFRQNLLALCRCRVAPRTAGGGLGAADQHHYHHHHHHHDDGASRCALATVNNYDVMANIGDSAVVAGVTAPATGEAVVGICCEQRTLSTRLTVSVSMRDEATSSCCQQVQEATVEEVSCQRRRQQQRLRRLRRRGERDTPTDDNGIGYHGNYNNNNNSNHRNGECRLLNGLEEDSDGDDDDAGCCDIYGQTCALLVEVPIFVHTNNDQEEPENANPENDSDEELESGHV